MSILNKGEKEHSRDEEEGRLHTAFVIASPDVHRYETRDEWAVFELCPSYPRAIWRREEVDIPIEAGMNDDRPIKLRQDGRFGVVCPYRLQSIGSDEAKNYK